MTAHKVACHHPAPLTFPDPFRLVSFHVLPTGRPRKLNWIPIMQAFRANPGIVPLTALIFAIGACGPSGREGVDGDLGDDNTPTDGGPTDGGDADGGSSDLDGGHHAEDGGIEQPPANALVFTRIAAGNGHTCALNEAGKVYCWGGGFERTTGSTEHLLKPQPIDSQVTFTSLTTSPTTTHSPHHCGLTATGDAYCWGGNTKGQLGDGSTTASTVPGLVAGGLSFKSISAGDDHTCALTLAGKAYCWGDNFWGELGFSPYPSHENDRKLVPTEVLGTHQFSEIYAGEDHSCALKADGDAFCWGGSAFDQLGIGDAELEWGPNLVAGGHNWKTMAIDMAYSCAITSAGDAYCWGRYFDGMFDAGGATSVEVPTRLTTSRTFSSAAVSRRYACWIDSGEQVGCIGDLWTGAATSTEITTRTPNGLAVKALAAGSNHACVLDAAGHAWCWGSNGWGQLGDGTKTARDSLKPVVAP